MTTQTTTSETHAVFATTADGKRVRVSDHLSWDAAQLDWNRLDELRFGGRFPHVQHFAVRSTDDPQWSNAPLSLLHRSPVVEGSRGFKNVENAARAAWKLFTGNKFHRRAGVGREVESDTPGRPTGVQGRGGWFYWPNGATAAQALSGLAGVCKRRNFVVQGADGRWYVVDQAA